MDPFIDVKKVFHLSCPDRSKIVARFKKRAIKDNRLDDANEEVIGHRLETYERESKPLLDHYGDDLIVKSMPPTAGRGPRHDRFPYGRRPGERLCRGEIDAPVREFPRFFALLRKCGRAMPVRERLLLVLPGKESTTISAPVAQNRSVNVKSSRGEAGEAFGPDHLDARGSAPRLSVMRVVFLGSGAIGVPSLKALVAAGAHEVRRFSRSLTAPPAGR